MTGVIARGPGWHQGSRPSLLLGRKIARLRDETNISALEWYNPDASPDLATLLNLIVVRPVTLLVSEPLVIMVAIISAVSWGMIYLFTEALTQIYVSIGFTTTQASLPFLAIAAGVLFTFLPRFWDMKVVRDRNRKNEHVEPYVGPLPLSLSFFFFGFIIL